MQNDLQMLLLILGTVIAAFVVYKSLRERNVQRKAPTRIRREFQKTIIKNTHKAEPYKKNASIQMAESDPLMDGDDNSYTELPQATDSLEPIELPPQAQPKASSPAYEIVTLTLIPRNAVTFPGLELSVVFEEEGYQFGKMKLFHRHEQHDPAKPVLFSIASMVEPGVFNRDTMAHENYRGIVLWMVFQSTSKPDAFEKMLSDAKHLAEKLNATLCDENRKQLTVHTISEIRTKIQECCYCEPSSQSAN